MRVVKTSLNIKKFCNLILKNNLYAEWGNIKDWSTDIKRYNVVYVALAYMNEIPVGTAIISRNKNKVYKVSIFVKSQYRRLGIGTRLFNALPDNLKKKGVIQYPFEKIPERIIITNRAKRFFDFLGKKPN